MSVISSREKGEVEEDTDSKHNNIANKATLLRTVHYSTVHNKIDSYSMI